MLSEKSDEHIEEKVAYLSCLRQNKIWKLWRLLPFTNS